MNIEIEKKILCKVMDIPVGTRKVIEQWYLIATSNIEFRVRNVNNKTFTATVKYGQGYVRKEWEWSISSFLYSCLSFLAPWGVKKIRYVDGPWEVDIYRNLRGLAVAEVELSSPDEKLPYIPHWLLAISNITSKPEWKNKNIALNGLPRKRKGRRKA